MLVPGITRQLAVTSSVNRARRKCEWDIVRRIDTSNAVLSIRTFPPQPPRCDPAKDCPARIQEYDVSQHDGEEKFESAFLFWYGTEIP